jgi:hypothetical protein
VRTGASGILRCCLRLAFVGLATVVGLAALVGLAAPVARATPLVTNGGFEGGFAGWSGAGIQYFGQQGLQQPTAANGWTLYDDPGAPWYDVPSGILPAGGADMATFYPDGPLLGILYQEFTVAEIGASVSVSFDFYTDAGPATEWPCGFDVGCAGAFPPGSYYPDELFRVDVVRGDADPFSTVSGEHLPLLDGTDVYAFPSLPQPYLHVEFDVSDFVADGGSFYLRFAGYGDQALHVDNASVEQVPEPSTGLLLATALLGALQVGRPRRH